MRSARRTASLGAVRRWLLLTLTLSGILVVEGRVFAQEPFTKVDCGSADAHLLPPAGLEANCYQGPFDKAQGIYDCRLANVTIGAPPNANQPSFYVRARYPRIGSKLCATIGFPNPTGAMQHVHRFVESQATNWSALQQVGDDLQLMFFDAKNQTQNGKCFTFTKTGPPAGKTGGGHAYTMIGFFCKAPGQPLDATKAATLVNSLQLRP
jgi:hypothetical protein